MCCADLDDSLELGSMSLYGLRIVIMYDYSTVPPQGPGGVW